jgi:DNA-binding transcriptional LysR family regulator
MLDFKYRVFLSAAKLLSFSKAAKELSLTQPAISFQIRHLEEELGARLFVRYPNRIELTSVGTLLLKESGRLQSESLKMQEHVMQMLDKLWGSISVGASSTIGNYFLPPILAEFKSRYDDVSVKVVVGNTDEVLSYLSDGIVDFAIVEGPVKPKLWEVEKLFIDELVVIAPKDYTEARKGIITKKQLSQRPFITREMGSGTRAVIDSLKNGNQPLIPPSNVILELGSTTAIKRVVEDGLGVSIVSLMTLEKELRVLSLAVLRIPSFHLYRNISCVYPKGIEKTALVKEMVKMCKVMAEKITAKKEG